MITDLLNKIKSYAIVTLGFISGVLALLFLYERNQNIANDALLKQDKVNRDLDKMDNEIAHNNDSLKAEEASREKIKRESNDKASDEDITKYLGDRK